MINRDREKIKAYKRAEYKSEAPFIHCGDHVRRDAALYDPRRDDPLHHSDLTALLMGDPPIGRRAIDHDIFNQSRPRRSAVFEGD